jgi:hypothetical protein
MVWRVAFRLMGLHLFRAGVAGMVIIRGFSRKIKSQRYVLIHDQARYTKNRPSQASARHRELSGLRWR